MMYQVYDLDRDLSEMKNDRDRDISEVYIFQVQGYWRVYSQFCF